MNYDILVAGEINPDLILAAPGFDVRFGQVESLVEHAELAIGSSSAIFACGAARLGLKVVMIGVVGDDIFGHFMQTALAERGVDVSPVIIDPNEHTGISVILARGQDRAILTYPGAMSALRASQVPDALLTQARHLHLASYFLQTAMKPGLPDLLQRARRHGLSVSLDPNWDPDERWEGFDQLLPLVDVFLPNQAEALSLAGGENLDVALQRLSSLSRIVAVKRGEHGAIVRSGEQVFEEPARPMQVADTVGAGDSFNAGFIYGYLHGWPLPDCLRLATSCGTLSTRLPGGTQSQANLEEAQKFLEQS